MVSADRDGDGRRVCRPARNVWLASLGVGLGLLVWVGVGELCGKRCSTCGRSTQRSGGFTTYAVPASSGDRTAQHRPHFSARFAARAVAGHVGRTPAILRPPYPPSRSCARSAARSLPGPLHPPSSTVRAVRCAAGLSQPAGRGGVRACTPSLRVARNEGIPVALWRSRRGVPILRFPPLGLRGRWFRSRRSPVVLDRLESALPWGSAGENRPTEE